MMNGEDCMERNVTILMMNGELNATVRRGGGYGGPAPALCHSYKTRIVLIKIKQKQYPV